MILYRYELFCENEPQDIGFLVGLDELGFSSEKEDYLLNPFNAFLEIPDSPNMRNSVSFFTETGIRFFENAIANVIQAYNDSIFDVVLVTIESTDIPNKDIIHQDEHQICIPIECYKSIQANYIFNENQPALLLK